uniref:Uncharacterized protein n=1 Tax=Rhizophora mucronata TaxID=61149 RepID=A0A2P2PLA5_RHIMU
MSTLNTNISNRRDTNKITTMKNSKKGKRLKERGKVSPATHFGDY